MQLSGMLLKAALVCFLLGFFTVPARGQFETTCNSQGERCIVPFQVNGKTHRECVTQGNHFAPGVAWCLMEELGNGQSRLSPCANCTGNALCYTKGNAFPKPFRIECPSTCSAVAALLWGSDVYSEDSYVCAAAIHSGALAAGRTATIQVTSHSAPDTYVSSTQNGLTSNQKPGNVAGFQVRALQRDANIPVLAVANTVQGGVIKPGASRNFFINGLKNAFSVDIDYRRQYIYFSDNKIRKIIRVEYGLPLVQVRRFDIVQDDYHLLKPQGVAVDWVHQNLYWTDSEFHAVKVSTADGNYTKTIIQRNDTYSPRGIALDPATGYMYIGDGGPSPKIEKCGMDGSQCTTIVNTRIKVVTGIALDFSASRIYWADALLKEVSSAQTDGSNRRNLVVGQKLTKFPVGITVAGSRVFWTSYDAMAILSADKVTGKNMHIMEGDLKIPNDVKAMHPDQQPMSANRCANSQCSQLCLARPGGHQCECANGYRHVDSLRRTCVKEIPTFAPGTHLDMVIADLSTLRHISYDWSRRRGTPNVLANGFRNVVALAYDPVGRHLYWSDVLLRNIYRGLLSDDYQLSQVETVLFGSNHSDYLRTADGMAVDWISGNLYWTDVALHAVFVTKLSEVRDETQIATVFKREKTYMPRAIVTHPAKGWLFISDWGTNPKIERCAMDGKSCITIISTNVGWPNGMVIDFELERLYWVDAKRDAAKFSNFDGTLTSTVMQHPGNIPHPFSIAVYHNKAYYTDWGHKALISMDKLTGRSPQYVVTGMFRPTAFLIIDREYAYPQSVDVCSLNGCSHTCVPVPDGAGGIRAKCVCPDIFRSQSAALQECRENTNSGENGLVTNCAAGFQPSPDRTLCIDRDECLVNNGGCHQVCVNTEGSFNCSCNEGFELNSDGTTCTQTENACTAQPCLNGGACRLSSEREEGYTCACAQGFRGDDCSLPFGSIRIDVEGQIPKGRSFRLTCVVPLTINAVILWHRNREVLERGRPGLRITDGGRTLQIFQATYKQAGEYKCQFSFRNTERTARRFVSVQTRPREICGQALPMEHVERVKAPRIIGGRAVPALGAPFMVFLYKTTEGDLIPRGLFCGGSILEPQRIVTAAHCVNSVDSSEIRVYAGKLNADIDLIEPYQQWAGVSWITTYDDFNASSFHGDIAVLTLDRPLNFTNGVKPLCVPLASNNDQDLKPRPASGNLFKYGMVFGWGVTQTRTNQRVLREVKLPIRRQSFCSKANPDMTKLMFCAGGLLRQDSCQGDSGGPFALWSDRTQKWWLAGIVSWGDGCGDPNKPGVYTRVGTSLREWLYSNADMF